MLERLKDHFGFDAFLPGQEEIITTVLDKNDALVLMPTGGGKSLCYQLPALCFDGLTVVVSPLIALMKDQVDNLRANGIAGAYLNSTLTASQSAKVQAMAKNGDFKILYLAPERLALPGFRQFLSTLTVSLFAIDEAHCISEWGHDFRPDYRNLKTLRRDFPDVPLIALTATATEQVQGDIIAQLGLRDPGVFISGLNRSNLTYTVRHKRKAFDALVDLLSAHKNESAIVYCFSRKDTENLAEDLDAVGLKALPYHAGLSREMRQDNQEKFIHDRVPIIVATIAFGMGIDKPDVRLLVHYDLPKSLEGYYQETGRAGRDGLPSECVLFYSLGDKVKHDFFIDQMEQVEEKENARLKLSQVVEYCELNTCRRRHLLAYFGESPQDANCGGCDICLTPREEYDATEIAQKILSAVIRTGQRFGGRYIAQVLQGSGSKKVKENGHQDLTVFGIARESTDDDLKQVTNALVNQRLMVKSVGTYPTLSVTAEGMAFLKGRDSLTLDKPKAVAENSAGFQAEAIPPNLELLEVLRDLRTNIADQRNLPAYVIFGDASLRQMASHLPKSRESFSRITGVGSVKLEELSGPFLKVIVEYAEANGLAEIPIDSGRANARQRTSGRQRTGDRRSRYSSSSTLNHTKELVELKLSVDEIAQRRSLASSTVAGQIERLVQDGAALDLDHLMPPPERMETIKAAFLRTGDVRLAPVRESLGDGYSYDEIRMVRIALFPNGVIVPEHAE